MGHSRPVTGLIYLLRCVLRCVRIRAIIYSTTVYFRKCVLGCLCRVAVGCGKQRDRQTADRWVTPKVTYLIAVSVVSQRVRYRTILKATTSHNSYYESSRVTRYRHLQPSGTDRSPFAANFSILLLVEVPFAENSWQLEPFVAHLGCEWVENWRAACCGSVLKC